MSDEGGGGWEESEKKKRDVRERSVVFLSFGWKEYEENEKERSFKLRE